MMHNAKWISAIIIAFVAGYIFHSMINNSLAIEKQRAQESVEKPSQPLLQSKNVAELRNTAETLLPENEKSLSSSNKSTSVQKENTPRSIPNLSIGDVVDKTELQSRSNEISDADIDKVVPAPFNKSLKNHHGTIREKFKEYATAASADEWSVQMQNKITDFILSNPYAKYINLEFVGCKADLCELRLYENKKGARNYILSEMTLQDWWDIGGYSASGNSVSADKPDTTTWHVLLPKK